MYKKERGNIMMKKSIITYTINKVINNQFYIYLLSNHLYHIINELYNNMNKKLNGVNKYKKIYILNKNRGR